MSTMVNKCFAAGCLNTHSKDVSLFTSPRDPVLNREVEKTSSTTRGPTTFKIKVVLLSHTYQREKLHKREVDRYTGVVYDCLS